MRLVTYPNFCKACSEGLWLSLLQRIDLLDDVNEGCIWTPASSTSSLGHWKKRLNVQLVPLAHLRVEPVSSAESFTITWSKDGQIIERFENETSMEMNDGAALGTFSIDVTFRTEEVRKDPHGHLISNREYTISKRCGS
jgi:hypothetical protein